MTKKILSIIFSLVFIFALAFSISWGVINFNKVRTGMATTGVYTNEDINKSYEDGYNNALQDKAEYTATIDECRDTITSLNDRISQLSSQVNDLTANNSDYSNQIRVLTELRNNLENQVQTLSQDKEKNAATIQSLNSAIYNLNKQISDMNYLSQNYSAQIKGLNSRINELQSSLTYYENYVATFESEQKAVVTFEYDNSVYNLQVVNKGTKLAINDPVSTKTKNFNGWKVNGNFIDKNSFVVNESTKIVADITYRCPVKFLVDYQLFDNQYVVKDATAVLPTNPSKDGYEFIGWSLNGVDTVSGIETTPVTEEVTYHAIFIKLHTVNFIVDEQTVSTQIIRDGNYASNVTVESKGQFKGWTVDGTIIDLATYPIHNDTTFVTDILKANWVNAGFKSEKAIYGSNVWTDGTNIYYSNYVSKKSGQVHYVLDNATGNWNPMSWNGIDNVHFKGDSVWTDGQTVYYSQGPNQFTLNKATHTWVPKEWDIKPWYGDSIWFDGTNAYDGSKVFDKGSGKWVSAGWQGLDGVDGEYVWTDCDNNYYFSANNKNYRLNKETRTWIELNWSIEKLDGRKIWNDGKNVYYLNEGKYYLIDVKNGTLKEIQMLGGPASSSSTQGWNIWKDGENIYYSFGTKSFKFVGWYE